ncbi:histidinol-phosphatase [Candidatus Venteria ishoeyi]|uniref:Histidinol-phosphatase n=1 Tax=Candidatus Venteria ishoeyi TaxID=1899563 RepID=A0A1H6F9Y5_9GAMM|nr:HAD family hydrolase [Candidatus Venteria ishoeyi]SEH06912.1 Phosphoserine phosphatase [Candidatus Venteria ishoeyi]
MKLAIFDLDNTLLGGDSDESWGDFMVELGLRDAETYGQKNQAFYQDYLNGTLDIFAFQRFMLEVVTEHPLEQMLEWRSQFLEQKIKPILLPKAFDLIKSHRQQGHELLIITATNRFITGPIAELLGIEDMLATEPEMLDGQYTGDLTGTPCFAEGKITRLKAWLEERGASLEQENLETWFYSDSRNDTPLLEQVTHPFAVDPDPTLKQTAQARGWKILSLR